MLEASQRRDRNRGVMHHVVSGCRLLILGEVGYHLPMSRKQANLFLQVVAKRYGRSSMILTLNLTFGSWDAAFAGDSGLAAANARLYSPSRGDNHINGESYRLKDKRKADLLLKLAKSAKESYRAAARTVRRENEPQLNAQKAIKIALKK